MRLAFASPLPPLTSGIADYAAELVPALAAAGAELTLFFEGGEAPRGEALSAFPARPVRELPGARGAFDAVLYQMGNSGPHHAGIYRALLESPGHVLLHEFMLHHLVRELTLARGDGAAYVEEMRYCAGEIGRRAAQRLLDTHRPVDPWSFPLFERVVDRSLGILVHSDFARRRILASRPQAAVEVVPFPADLAGLPEVDSARRAVARQELGLPVEGFVLASFGFVTPHKRLDAALAAFARFRRTRPEARFLVCGEVAPQYDLRAVLDAVGEAGVTVTGRVPLVQFHRTMEACDVAVNLRYPTGGETSASLLRLLASGIPTLVTDVGSFSELPDGVVAKVAMDEHEIDHLEALYGALAADEGLRRAMSSAARRHVETRHAVGDAARSLLAALERLGGRTTAPDPAVPPLAPWPRHDPRIALAAGIGADVADLGLAGDDGEILLAETAELLAELDWAPRPEPVS